MNFKYIPKNIKNNENNTIDRRKQEHKLEQQKDTKGQQKAQTAKRSRKNFQLKTKSRNQLSTPGKLKQ